MSNLTSPLGVSPSITRLENATRRLQTIVDNAKQMAEWQEKRRAAVKRELPAASREEVAHKTEELVEKMSFLDENKAYLMSALDVVNYDTTRVDAEVEELHRRTQVLREEIEHRDNRTATDIMHQNLNLQEFKSLIQEAVKEPVMAEVIYGSMPAYIEEQQESCRSLEEIVKTVSSIESDLYSLFTIVHEEEKKSLQNQVDDRIGIILDITQTKLAELETLTDSVLDPFKSIDASEWSDIQVKLDTLKNTRLVYEQKIEATKVVEEERVTTLTASHKKDQQILGLRAEVEATKVMEEKGMTALIASHTALIEGKDKQILDLKAQLDAAKVAMYERDKQLVDSEAKVNATDACQLVNNLKGNYEILSNAAKTLMETAKVVNDKVVQQNIGITRTDAELSEAKFDYETTTSRLDQDKRRLIGQLLGALARSVLLSMVDPVSAKVVDDFIEINSSLSLGPKDHIAMELPKPLLALQFHDPVTDDMMCAWISCRMDTKSDICLRFPATSTVSEWRDRIPWLLDICSHLLGTEEITSRQACLVLHYLVVVQAIADGSPSIRSTLLQQCTEIVGRLKKKNQISVMSSFILSAMLEQIESFDEKQQHASWVAKATEKARIAPSTDSNERARVLNSTNSDLEGLTLVEDEVANLLVVAQDIDTLDEKVFIFEMKDILCFHWKDFRAVLRIKPSSSAPAGWERLLLQKEGPRVMPDVFYWAARLDRSLYSWTYAE
ncbi:Mfp1p [Xylographa soralifera]|nr:Mfp1p [Xylographa soralifera]